jgi:hypothetical protein
VENVQHDEASLDQSKMGFAKDTLSLFLSTSVARRIDDGHACGCVDEAKVGK